MKTRSNIKVLLGFVLMASFVAAPALRAAAVSRTPAAVRGPAAATTLLVRVSAPTLAWRPFYQENVERYLTLHIRRQFHRAGFKGPVVYLRSWSKPNPVLPRLSISLIEWRLDPVGDVDCTFSATLHTPGHVKDLGIITSSQFTWDPGFNHFEMENAFEDAAEGAIGHLCHRVERSGLLPGFSAT